MMPSPMRADCQRSTSPSPASAIASPAITTASQTTTGRSCPPTIASTTLPASTGVDTARTAEMTVSTRKASSRRQCGRAKRATRLNVPRLSPFGTSLARIAELSSAQVLSTGDPQFQNLYVS